MSLSSTGVLSPPLIPIFRDHFKTFHILSQIRHDTALKAHIMKKKTGWTELTFAKVDWKAHKRAFTRLTRIKELQQLN